MNEKWIEFGVIAAVGLAALYLISEIGGEVESTTNTVANGLDNAGSAISTVGSFAALAGLGVAPLLFL